jgi:hypothetical protein
MTTNILPTELHLLPNEIDLSSPKSFPEIIFEKKQTQPKPDPETGKTEKPQTYNTAPLIYNHFNKKTKKYVPQTRWLVKGPVMTSRGGIVAESKQGRWGAYILCSSLDPKDPGMSEFLGSPLDLSAWLKMPEESTDDTVGRDAIGFMQNLHLRCMEYAFPVRKNLGMDSVKKADSFESVFKSPIKWKTDANGNPVEGAPASAFWKVFLMGDPNKLTTRKATFSIPDPSSKTGETVLPWRYLQECEMTFEPLLLIKSCYAGGGKGSIQIEIVSAVVHDFKRLNSEGQQKELIEKYTEDTTLVSKLAEQLEQMKELLGDTTSNSTKKSTDEGKKKLPSKSKKDDDDEEDDDKLFKNKKLPPKGKSVKNVDDDEEDDDALFKKKKLPLPKPKDIDEDEEEDTKSKTKSKDKQKEKAKVKDVDEDEEEDSKSKSKSKEKAKVKDVDEDEEEEEDSKKKSKPKEKTKAKDADEEEESSKTKLKEKSKEKTKTKDTDEEEEEDSKAKSKEKPKEKAKVNDDDDDVKPLSPKKPPVNKKKVEEKKKEEVEDSDDDADDDQEELE